MEDEGSMSVTIVHPSVEERRARGKKAGNRTPPHSHAGSEPVALDRLARR